MIIMDKNIHGGTVLCLEADCVEPESEGESVKFLLPGF